MLKLLTYYFLAELTLLVRRSDEWLYPLGFFFIVICLFPLALTPDPIFLKKNLPGFTWVAALLANLLATEKIFDADKEDGFLEQMLLSQLSLSLLILVKLIAQWIMIGLPLVLLTLVLGVILDLSIKILLFLCLSLLIGTPALTYICGLGLALTLGLRQQGVFLGLLILPLTIPVLIFGVIVAQQLQNGLQVAGPLAFLAALSLIAITILPWTIAQTLCISLDD